MQYSHILYLYVCIHVQNIPELVNPDLTAGIKYFPSHKITKIVIHLKFLAQFFNTLLNVLPTTIEYHKDIITAVYCIKIAKQFFNPHGALNFPKQFTQTLGEIFRSVYNKLSIEN